MDNAEISTNPNAIGSFHGIDAHKKALFVEHSAIDSGFLSIDQNSISQNWSISHSNVAASTSGLSSSAKFSSSLFKRSTDLEPISENVEPSGLQETPTTRSARHLDAFHINTPQNDRNHMETTPKKANYFSNPYDSGLRDSDKQNSSQNSIRWSLDKSSPRLRSSAQRKSFSARSTLFESIDENYDENTYDEVSNPCDQSIGVSPIKHNNSIMIAKQPEKVQGLQRYPSGIESSTPKNTFKRTRTQSIVKTKASLADELTRNRLIRKTQSFSPAKRLALREKFQQNVIQRNDECIDTDKPFDNPARKVLDFTPTKFDKLINKMHHNTSANIVQPPIDSMKCNQNETEAKGASAKYLPLKRLDKCSSRLVQEYSRKKLMRQPTLMLSNKSMKSLNESDILMSLATEENETDSQKCAKIDNGDDSAVSVAIKTPSTNCKSKAIFSDTPNRNDFIKKDICEQANRTPTKRFEKSTSYHHFSSVKSSPEKEKFEIVYGHLPCTPPKKYPRRQLKRPASVARADSPACAPSAKRKLYTICPRPSFYNGLEKLDILSHLKKFEMVDIVENILEYLPDESLQSAYSVCKSWKAFVDGNRKFRARRRKFVKTMLAIKENVHRNEIKPVINNNNNVKPLHVHNLNCGIEEKLMAVSPSTQRYNEHQSILKNLKPEQRVLHCPRCNGTSIVYPVTVSKVKVQRRSPRRQVNSMSIYQDRSLRSSKGSATKTQTNNTIGKIVISEYAVCSKKACGFEFCTNCNCDRHLNAKCTKRPLGSSPKSDEDSPYIRPEYRTTKRRLGRLVF